MYRSQRRGIVDLEIKIYELLGVRLFRKLVMFLESLKHRKDKGHNVNYHLSDHSASAASSFFGYSIYNAALHVVSSVLAVIYLIVSERIDGMYAIKCYVWVVLVINIYCIMLQRYTSLRLKRFLLAYNRKKAKLADKYTKQLKELIHAEEEHKSDTAYSLLKRVKSSFETGDDLLISMNDISALHTISDLRKRVVPIADKAELSEGFADDVVIAIPKSTPTVLKAERLASKLQRLLHFPASQNILFGVEVVTQSKECEEAFKEAFGSGGRDAILFITDTMINAYSAVFNLEEKEAEAL